MKKYAYIMLALCALFMSFYCITTTDDSEKDNKDSIKIGRVTTIKTDDKLNITLFLDLSDRISPAIAKDQPANDMEIVRYFCTFFKDSTMGKDILKKENRIKVLFYPSPTDPQFNKWADSLKINIKDLEGKDKRLAAEGASEKFPRILTQIYDNAIETNQWPGCDIWGFFSNKKVDDLCINKGFRNILVILTDGYLLHEQNMIQKGNEYNYITEKVLNDPKAQLMVTRDGLSDLEVLVLEINPKDPKKLQTMQTLLQNWFVGMGVKPDKLKIIETGLPANTIEALNKYFQP